FNAILRNFDPVTAAESTYINGRLWTYVAILDGLTRSIAVNSPVDPLDIGRFDPVASFLDTFFGGFSVGSYYSGLTRDDVGAIKYMFQPNNKNFEAAIPGSVGAGFVVGSGGGGGNNPPWGIPGTNVTTTNVTGGTITTNGLI